MNEKIIVTLTSYGERLCNLPIVIASIITQTRPPKLIVLNIADNETIPSNTLHYLVANNVEINMVPDTKVYKKLIPTLRRYPNDLIINIDDDFVYPPQMIEDFIKQHNLFPNNPITGNDYVINGIVCHCGCASLTKALFFGDFLNTINESLLLKECPADDIAYSYFATKSGHPYIPTINKYNSDTLQPIETGSSYSEQIGDTLYSCLNYLVNTFGQLPNFTENYIGKGAIADLLYYIHKETVNSETGKVRESRAYLIGKKITSPFKLFRSFMKK